PLLTPDQPDPDILSLAAQAYESVGDTPKAVSLLRQAIVLNPANADYYVAFATLCLDHDSFQVGIDMTNAGLSRIPDNPSLYISRGLLYGQLAEFDKAEADFNIAERLDGKQSISLYAKDIIEFQRGMSDKTYSDQSLSISEIRAQLKTHPDSALLHFMLAKLLVNEDSDTNIKVTDDAMNSALLAVKLQPDLVQARDLLSSMYMSVGKYGAAIEQCRIALQYAPSDRTALYHLIIALRHSGQSGQRDEIQELVKRLSDLQQSALQEETAKKRFKLVEEPSLPSQ